MLRKVHLIICSAVLILFVTKAQTTSLLNETAVTLKTIAQKVEENSSVVTPTTTTKTTITNLKLSQQLPKASNVAITVNQRNQEQTSKDNVEAVAVESRHSAVALEPSTSVITSETASIGKFWSSIANNRAQHTTDEKENDVFMEKRTERQHDVGYISFEPTESYARKQPNAESVNQMILNLFPQGFTEMFGFSRASEPGTTTTRRPAFSPMPSSFAQAFKKLYESARRENDKKQQQQLQQPAVIYGLEASVSKEYPTKPGQREIVVEKITLEPPKAPFLSAVDILKINKAVANATDNSQQSNWSNELAPHNSYLMLNDIPTETEELLNEAEDNRISESRNYYFQSIPNFTYTKAKSGTPNVYYSHNDNYLETATPTSSVESTTVTSKYANRLPHEAPTAHEYVERARFENYGKQKQPELLAYDPFSSENQTSQESVNEVASTQSNVTPSSIVFVTIGTTQPTVTAAETPEKRNTKPLTQVEVQQSINVRNKQITEQDGRLVEMHETIYHPEDTEQKNNIEQQNYVSFSNQPIHVEPLELEAQNLRNAQSALDVSNPQYSMNAAEQPHLFYPVPSNAYLGPLLMVPEIPEQSYALAYQNSMSVPYQISPYAMETIVEKPMPYPVEKVVEKIVEKHVPIEVERIVEKPVEKIVEKVVKQPIQLPMAFPISILPNQLDVTKTKPTLNHLPMNALQNYFLQKLLTQGNLKKYGIPKKSIKGETKLPVASFKPNYLPLATKKPLQNFNDLHSVEMFPPPPPPPAASSWLKGYRYVYNTLPKTLPAPPLNSYGNRYVRTMPLNSDVNDDLRWRNGHVLKRSAANSLSQPHMEYGFKPPLVPSVEIDQSGVPLHANQD